MEPVFALSGNSWRGHLRDLAAVYMLERLGDPRLPLDAFHLLFSGGRIGGEQSVDIARARAYRRAIPMIALWGGGVGNQILPGKLRVTNSYPLCAEALPVLPPEHRHDAAGGSYRGLTFEKSFTRTDDGKRPDLERFMGDGLALPPAQPEQLSLWRSEPPKKRVKDGPADQMRMTSELLAPGVRLATTIDALDVSEVELGCLTSALHLFSRSPHIGGQSSRGHGLVSLTYDLIDLDTGERRHFLSIDGGAALLAPVAAAAKDQYDQYLRDQYDAMLAARGGEIAGLLGGA